MKLNYFDFLLKRESCEAQSDSVNKKVSSINESLIEYSIPELKDTEYKSIMLILNKLTHKESIRTIIKSYLRGLSFQYDKIW